MTDRKNRLQAIADVRVEIQERLADPNGGTPVTAISRQHAFVGRVVLLMAGAILGVIAARIVWPPPPDTRPVGRFVVTLPGTDQLRASGLALSPDGGNLVYSAARGGVDELHWRSMDQGGYRRRLQPISPSSSVTECNESCPGKVVSPSSELAHVCDAGRNVIRLATHNVH